MCGSEASAARSLPLPSTRASLRPQSANVRVTRCLLLLLSLSLSVRSYIMSRAPFQWITNPSHSLSSNSMLHPVVSYHLQEKYCNTVVKVMWKVWNNNEFATLKTKRGKLISFNVIVESFGWYGIKLVHEWLKLWFLSDMFVFICICNKRNKCNFLLAQHVYFYIAPFPITLYIHDIT